LSLSLNAGISGVRPMQAPVSTDQDALLADPVQRVRSEEAAEI
jgi:hypothetical protein